MQTNSNDMDGLAETLRFEGECLASLAHPQYLPGHAGHGRLAAAIAAVTAAAGSDPGWDARNVRVSSPINVMAGWNDIDQEARATARKLRMHCVVPDADGDDSVTAYFLVDSPSPAEADDVLRLHRLDPGPRRCHHEHDCCGCWTARQVDWYPVHGMLLGVRLVTRNV